MSLLDTMIKNINLPEKLQEITERLNKEFNTQTGILIFDSKVYIIDAIKSGDIEIIKEIDLTELLTKK